MDEIDRASEREAFFNRQAIDEIRAMVDAGTLADGSEFCEECGEEIPTARRDAVPGCTLCVVCQGMMERGL